MNTSDILKKRAIEFLKAIEKSRSCLAVRCGLCIDIVWYRQMKHTRKVMYRKKRHNESV